MTRLRTSEAEVIPKLTGLSSARFDQVLGDFDGRWRQRYAGRTISGEVRRRKVCGCHPTVLDSSRQKLLFILFYARFYPSQESLALIFGLSQGQVSQWLARLIPVAVAALGQELISPSQRRTKFRQLVSEVPEVLAIIRERSSRESDGREPNENPVATLVHALVP